MVHDQQITSQLCRIILQRQEWMYAHSVVEGRKTIMKRYEKPIVLQNSDFSEGVYTASGDDALKCDSVYMLGVWQKGSNNGKDAGYKERFGCQGCQAYTGNGCKLLDGSSDSIDPADELKPAWERNGHGPYDTE